MKNLLKRFVIWLLQGIIGAVFVLGFAVVLAAWLAGCGEPYVDSKGRTHIDECSFVTFHVSELIRG